MLLFWTAMSVTSVVWWFSTSRSLNCSFCVCVWILWQTFTWKWTPQMMNQPQDCIHHCKLQRWHLDYDRKCDELSILHTYIHTRSHVLWITVMYPAVSHIWHGQHIGVHPKENWFTLNKSARHCSSSVPHASTLFQRWPSVTQILMKWIVLRTTSL